MRWLSVILIIVLAQSALAAYTMFLPQEGAVYSDIENNIRSSHVRDLAEHLGLSKEIVDAQNQNHAAQITKTQIKADITQVEITIDPFVTLENAIIYEVTNAKDFIFYDPAAVQNGNIISWDYETIRKSRTIQYAYKTNQDVKSSTIILASPTELPSPAKSIIPLMIFIGLAVFVLGGGVTSMVVIHANSTPKEIEKYIKSQRSAGKSDVFIHYEMHKSGWSDEDTLKYLKRIK